MCLDRLDEKTKPCKVGYKVMYEGCDGKLYSHLQGNGEPRRTGVWLDERDARYAGTAWAFSGDVIQKSKPWNPSFTEFTYPCGWHVYHTKVAARGCCPLDCCVVRVEVDEPVATGRQVGYRVTVCKKIKITEVLK